MTRRLPPLLTTGDDRLDALGTWIWDLRADHVTGSPEFAELLGMPPGSQIHGDFAWFMSCFVPASRRALQVELAESLNHGFPCKALLQLAPQPGAATQVRLSARPFRDSGGDTLFLVGTLQGESEPPAATGPGGPDQTSPWATPCNRRSAVAIYRRVSNLIQ